MTINSRLLYFLCIVLSLFPCIVNAQGFEFTGSDIETGNVRWGRDLQEAYKESERTSKPIFVLFQEVPG